QRRSPRMTCRFMMLVHGQKDCHCGARTSMTTGDGESVFVDTSVLVYAAVVSAPYHQHARQSLGQLQERGAELWVSRQVLREYLAVLSRPQTFARPLPIEVLVTDIRNFLTRFRVAEDGPVIMDRLLTLLLQVSIGGKQVHDANYRSYHAGLWCSEAPHGECERLRSLRPSDYGGPAGVSRRRSVTGRRVAA